MKKVKSEVLKVKPREALKEFVNDINNIRGVDETLHPLIEKQIKNYRKLTDENPLEYMKDKWFNSIKDNNNNIDYSVYADKNYCIDAWACWIMYSRIYLRLIDKSSDMFENINSILDLGNGIGKTTCALTEIWPNAKVTATNLKNTEQWIMNKELQKKYNYDLVEDSAGLGHLDLVFASEYFEHILEPIKHLDEIIENNTPNYMVVANSFGTVGIGHFYKYHVDGEIIDWKKIGRLFINRMRFHGYESIGNFWNNTPNVWKKIKD